MRTNPTAIAILAATGIGLAWPVGAQAQTYEHHRHHHHYYRSEHCHSAATTGTVLGAVGGALVGNALASHGGKTGGTLIGAGVGAVAGHEIGKHHCG
jgi:hypothetical protein